MSVLNLYLAVEAEHLKFYVNTHYKLLYGISVQQ